jgi:hypothetical protein
VALDWRAALVLAQKLRQLRHVGRDLAPGAVTPALAAVRLSANAADAQASDAADAEASSLVAAPAMDPRLGLGQHLLV